MRFFSTRTRFHDIFVSSEIYPYDSPHIPPSRRPPLAFRCTQKHATARAKKAGTTTRPTPDKRAGGGGHKETAPTLGPGHTLRSCTYSTKLRLAATHEARVQAARPDGVLVAHPGEEAL
jgi:hypothetical protein